MRSFLTLGLLSLLCLATGGCPATQNPPDNTGGQTDNTDNTGDTTGGDVSGDAISFGGTATGSVATTSSTTTADSQGNRKAPQQALSAGGSGWLTDLAGDPLLDAEGEPYPEFEVAADGSFGPLQGLPVGVELLLHVDTDGDGEEDLTTVFMIPAGEDGESGEHDDLICDPLSTVVTAKLFDILTSQGVDPETANLLISAVLDQVRQVFERLFAESGIELDLTLDQLRGLARAELAAFFDSFLPAGARRGADVFRGNLRLSLASDVEAVALAAAEIMVQAGFIVVDHPDGVDLSSLADLPNVEAKPLAELDLGGPGEGPAQPIGTPEDPTLGDAAQFTPMGTAYVSTLEGFDRNYDDAGGGAKRQGPIFDDFVLVRLAELHLDGRTISMEHLYKIVVDLEFGLGARFTYWKWNGPFEPPTQVFASADGQGLEVDLQALFARLESIMPQGSPDEIDAAQGEIRQAMFDFLLDTQQPTFDEIFHDILMEPVPDPRTLELTLSNLRAHLPFSRSGPAQLFVLANSDPFTNPTATAVTVDVTTGDEGQVTQVEYNLTGQGDFYVSFGPRTEVGMLVTLINSTTGRALLDHAGRVQMLEISDAGIFAPVEGANFDDVVSDSTTGYPMAPALRIPNPDFDPTQPADPQDNPPDFVAMVLMTDVGPDGEPVRVDFADDEATYNPAGRYYLVISEQQREENLFQLITSKGELVLDPEDMTQPELIHPSEIAGITLTERTFLHFFGIEVANPGYDPDGAPFYDDINDNDVQEIDEPSFDFRDLLGNPADWRSTRVETYYRRADNDGFVNPAEVDFASDTPRLMDGVELTPRNLKPRMNAYRFGNPAVTMALLTAFAPADFFDGTHALNGSTQLNPFMALAMLNLVFDGVRNIEATIDPDGAGPLPERTELVPVDLFVVPVGDPLRLIVNSFEDLSTPASP